jgi:hypothetical protein
VNRLRVRAVPASFGAAPQPCSAGLLAAACMSARVQSQAPALRLLHLRLRAAIRQWSIRVLLARVSRYRTHKVVGVLLGLMAARAPPVPMYLLEQ